MSDAHPPPPPPADELSSRASQRPSPPSLAGRPSSLYKQRSGSPDMSRDEVWLRRKGNSKNCRRPRSRRVTDDDLDELKACIELGFRFDSPEASHRLSDTLPALEFYYAVNKQYSDGFSTSATHLESPPPRLPPAGSPQSNIFSRGDDPQVVKTRLRQWAQVVACSVRQSSTC